MPIAEEYCKSWPRLHTDEGLHLASLVVGRNPAQKPVNDSAAGVPPVAADCQRMAKVYSLHNVLVVSAASAGQAQNANSSGEP